MKSKNIVYFVAGSIGMLFLYGAITGDPEPKVNVKSEMLQAMSGGDAKTPEKLIELIEYKSKQGAKESVGDLVERLKTEHPESEQAKSIDKMLVGFEKEREEARRIEKLGYKALKANSNVTLGDLKLSFSNVKIATRWIMDRYGDTYMYTDADRGNKYLSATVSISSKSNSPVLPAVAAYKMNNGKLELIGPMRYKFYRWKDYGTYLGNSHDFGNDFAKTETIRFTVGHQIQGYEKGTKFYIFVKNDPCVLRSEAKYSNPPVAYTNTSCRFSRSLSPALAGTDYTLIKIF